MKKLLFPVLVVSFFAYFHSAKPALAEYLYYNQPDSNGEIFASGPSYTSNYTYTDYWTPDRVDYIRLVGPINEAVLYADPSPYDSLGVMGTTTDGQYVDHINLWMSDLDAYPGTFKAFYMCSNGWAWSDVFDGSVLTSVPQKITFTFPKTAGNCNLQTGHVFMFGVYKSNGYYFGYPIGAYFLGSSNNPIPNAGIFEYINYESIESLYDIKAEIWTSKIQPARTPVLIVPGVLGTEMKKGDEILWASVLRMVNPSNSDSFMDPLGLNQDLTPFDAQVYANKVIDNPDGLFNYTEDLIHQFNVEGYIQGSGTDSTLFTFPYDWRYGASGLINSTTTNTDLLKQKIQDIMAQTGSDKVDVIAHSTGGLLVKKYVLENPTSHHINKAVLVGVPNLGSPKAYKALINGDNFGVTGLEDAEMKKIAQNMPIVYDLAPSQEYYNQAGSFFQIHNPFGALGQIDTDLDYAGTIQELNNKKLINSQAQINSQNLHTAEFDNYDMRNNGVDLYNIVGCKSATFGKFTEVVQKFSAPSYDFPKTTTGDGTVPLLSAQTVPADPNKVFFVPKADHGKMPSQDGIRQQIVNLISGSSLSTNGKILEHDAVQNNPGLCQIKGEQIKIKSPVSINITDQNGNISGLAEDGSIQNEIPGADFEIWGEHKYVFLPTDEGQTYTINLKGTGAGTFTLDDESIVGDQTIQTQVFSNLPVTTDLTGQVNLGTTTTLTLDNNGDGTNDATVSPSSILNAAQSQDLTAPVSASTISGLMGQIGYYRTNAAITLSAIDPDVNEDPSQTSGVLSIWYKLDGDATYRTYNNPISVAVEGVHSLKFFSTDKAGNNEIEQSVSFTIDKTAPTITLTSPVAGGQYLVNQSAAANFACADALSGIQTCQGSVGNGSNIDTSSSGNKTFTVIATDLAGNQNSQSVNYSVYKFSSLFSPITSDSKTFKKNTTVPVKFQLTDGNSHFYGLPTARLFLDPIGSTNGTPAVSNSAGNTGNIFKYDPIMQQYVFNLSTSMGLFTSGSSHTLRVVIDGDPLPHDQVNAIKIK